MATVDVSGMMLIGGCANATSNRHIIRREASALLVLLCWAMREPL